MLAVLVAGCGGGNVKSLKEDEGGRAPPRAGADAGAGQKPVPRDAGSPSTPPSTSTTNVGKPRAPEVTAPERVRADPIEGERLIGALSSDELQHLCQDMGKQIARAISLQTEVQCTGDAIVLSETTEECNAKRTACIGQAGASSLAEDSCATDGAALAQDCAEVSVADVRACADAWTKRLEQAAAKSDCGMVGTALDKPNLEDPEECQSIDARCGH